MLVSNRSRSQAHRDHPVRRDRFARVSRTPTDSGDPSLKGDRADPMPLDVSAVQRIQANDLVRGLWARLDIGDADPRRLLRGEVAPPPMRAWRITSGRPADIVGTTQAVLTLVSQRFRDTLTSLGMTGWTSLAVALDGSLPDDLTLLVVTGRCGPVYSARRNPVPGVPPLGDFIDPRNWDGSDLFVGDGLAEVFVAPDRVPDLRRARLRNLRIEPAALEPFRVE